MELSDQTDAPHPSSPGIQLPESTEDEATAFPETVWSVLKREVPFSLPRFEQRFFDHPSCNLGTIPTTPTLVIKCNTTRLESKFYFVLNYTLQSYFNPSFSNNNNNNNNYYYYYYTILYVSWHRHFFPVLLSNQR